MTLAHDEYKRGIVNPRTNEQIAEEYKEFDQLRLKGRLGCMLRAFELTDLDRIGHLTQREAAEMIGCGHVKVKYDLDGLSKIIAVHTVNITDLDPDNPEHQKWADEAYTDVRKPITHFNDCPYCGARYLAGEHHECKRMPLPPASDDDWPLFQGDDSEPSHPGSDLVFRAAGPTVAYDFDPIVIRGLVAKLAVYIESHADTIVSHRGLHPAIRQLRNALMMLEEIPQ